MVTYGVAIFILNLFTNFLEPLNERNIQPLLPTNENIEYRPFIRKLPEFNFWYVPPRRDIVTYWQERLLQGIAFGYSSDLLLILQRLCLLAAPRHVLCSCIHPLDEKVRQFQPLGIFLIL